MATANETPPDWKPNPLFGPAEDGRLAEKGDFELCRDNPRLSDVRGRFEDTWARLGYLCPEGPDQLPREFRAQFHERAWELYLIAACDGAGCKMATPPPAAPDICLTLPNGTRCWIEAIAASDGVDPTLFHYPVPMPPQLSYRLNDNAMLARYASAFSTKAAKVEGYRTKGIIGVQDAVIIAIYTGKIDCADHYDVFIPMVAKALFPIGDPQLRVPVQPSNEAVTETWASKPDIVKYNGARIETAEFTKAENAPISAVLYATDHILGMSWDPAAALSLIHNPLATVPVPQAMLPLRGEMWIDADGPLMHSGRCAGVGYYSREPGS